MGLGVKKKRILRMVRRSKRRRHSQRQRHKSTTTQDEASDTQRPSEEAKGRNRSFWLTFLYSKVPSFSSTKLAGNQEDANRCKGCKEQTSKVQSLTSKIRQQKKNHSERQQEFLRSKRDFKQQIRDKDEMLQQNEVDKRDLEQQIKDKDERLRQNELQKRDLEQQIKDRDERHEQNLNRIRMLEESLQQARVSKRLEELRESELKSSMLTTQLDEANKRVELCATVKSLQQVWRNCEEEMSGVMARFCRALKLTSQDSCCPRSEYEASGRHCSDKSLTTDKFSQSMDGGGVNKWTFDEWTRQVMSKSTAGLVSRSRSTSESSSFEVGD